MTIEAPLQIYRDRVRPEWIDYNGHMNVAYYVLAFDYATDAFFDHLGIGRDYKNAANCSTFAVEMNVLLSAAMMRLEIESLKRLVFLYFHIKFLEKVLMPEISVKSLGNIE